MHLVLFYYLFFYFFFILMRKSLLKKRQSVLERVISEIGFSFVREEETFKKDKLLSEMDNNSSGEDIKMEQKWRRLRLYKSEIINWWLMTAARLWREKGGWVASTSLNYGTQKKILERREKSPNWWRQLITSLNPKSKNSSVEMTCWKFCKAKRCDLVCSSLQEWIPRQIKNYYFFSKFLHRIVSNYNILSLFCHCRHHHHHCGLVLNWKRRLNMKIRLVPTNFSLLKLSTQWMLKQTSCQTQ